MRRVSFTGEIKRLWRLGLHTVCGLERLDPSPEMRVAFAPFKVLAIKKLEQASSASCISAVAVRRCMFEIGSAPGMIRVP